MVEASEVDDKRPDVVWFKSEMSQQEDAWILAVVWGEIPSIVRPI